MRQQSSKSRLLKCLPPSNVAFARLQQTAPRCTFNHSTSTVSMPPRKINRLRLIGWEGGTVDGYAAQSARSPPSRDEEDHDESNQLLPSPDPGLEQPDTASGPDVPMTDCSPPRAEPGSAASSMGSRTNSYLDISPETNDADEQDQDTDSDVEDLYDIVRDSCRCVVGQNADISRLTKNRPPMYNTLTYSLTLNQNPTASMSTIPPQSQGRVVYPHALHPYPRLRSQYTSLGPESTSRSTS